MENEENDDNNRDLKNKTLIIINESSFKTYYEC